MMMGYWYGGLGWISMVIHLVISVALITGVIFLVIWIVRQFRNGGPSRELKGNSPSAVEIAKERYAKGEINREEFQKLMADLETR